MSVLTEEREFLGILAAIVFSFGFLYHLITPAVFLITAVTGITAAAMGLVPLYLAGSSTISFRLAFFALFLVFVVPLGDAAIHLDWTLFSPISMILLFALAFVFFYYSIFFFPLAFLHVSQRESKCEPEPPYPKVSIIIPSYNEKSGIGAAIQALQQADYPSDNKEIIVVDDGSTDETYEEATKQADQTVTILQKPNGGKFTALNLGLEHASGEIIVTVDADSLLEKDTLKRIAGSFQNEPSLGAIAGNLTVANQVSFLTKLQELEYIVGIQLFRRAYDIVTTVIVVPGAFGAFRRRH